MIESIRREQFPICLDILRRSYENTAVTFGMTEENCPYRGRTRRPLQVFEKEYDEGYLMYVYVHKRRPENGVITMKTGILKRKRVKID